MTITHPTCLITAHNPEPQTPVQAPCISWGLPRDISPRFGARLVQRRYRFDFLSDRASLIGEWSEAQLDKLEQVSRRSSRHWKASY